MNNGVGAQRRDAITAEMTRVRNEQRLRIGSDGIGGTIRYRLVGNKAGKFAVSTVNGKPGNRKQARAGGCKSYKPAIPSRGSSTPECRNEKKDVEGQGGSQPQERQGRRDPAGQRQAGDHEKDQETPESTGLSGVREDFGAKNSGEDQNTKLVDGWHRR